MKILYDQLRKYLQSEKAVAATEFALTAPMLMFLMVSIIDLGSYIRDRMRLEQISRASVDYIMQGGEEDNIQTDVLSFFDPSHVDSYTLNTERICTCSDGFATDCSAITCDHGDYSRQYVQVTVDRVFTTFMPYPGIPQQMSLSGSARMRLD